MANSAYNLANPLNLLPASIVSLPGASGWFNAIYLRLTNGIKFNLNNVINGTPTTQNIPYNTQTKVTWGNVVTDSIGGFDSPSNSYIIQTQGTYMFIAQLLFNYAAAGGAAGIQILQNNVAMLKAVSYSSPYGTNTLVSVVGMIECNSKDIISINALQTMALSPIAIDGNVYNSFFQGHRIN